ncbi:putative pentatricopeptide [Rosa chinensis]|uniref:Putative pentatricopeptide n=1 Tax=Rosa chinensis TaxID=74649 RepID=A0A2P6SNI6_ROSCH|nr:putative pentatricopeptide [Rosa chinensis]
MVIKKAYVAITFVCNSLVNMYLKSGMDSEARAVFDTMASRDEVTWNSLIAGYVTNGLELEAFELSSCPGDSARLPFFFSTV